MSNTSPENTPVNEPGSHAPSVTAAIPASTHRVHGSFIESPWANRRALAAMIPLWALIASVIIACPWYSTMEIDTFTHWQQIRSVADHGSIGFEHGPTMQYPELHSRFLVPARGKNWGSYPVALAYLLAPGAKLGGFKGVIREIWLLLALATLMTYAVSYRLTRRPGIAVGSAYAVGAASSLPFWGIVTAPFIPVAAFGMSAVYLGSRVFDQPTRQRQLLYAAASGMLSSFAFGSHLLWLFAWVTIGAAHALYIPRREGVERGIAYLAGSAPVILLMSWVNHLRFNTFNPITYGPCSGDTCNETANDRGWQTVPGYLATIGILLPYVIAFGLSAYLLRRSRRHVVFLAFLAPCAALVPETETKIRLLRYLRAFWGYLVDLGSFDFGYTHPPDNVGSLWVFWNTGTWCVRSLLQCSPVLAVALLVRAPGRSGPHATRDRITWWMLVGTCAGILLVCVMRAHLPYGHVFGNPMVNLRYLAPAIPAATILAAIALADLPFRAWHAALAVAVAVTGAVLLSPHDDASLIRREITLWGPPSLAFLLWVATAAANLQRGNIRIWCARVAAVLAAVCVGYGGAVSFGIDRIVAKRIRGPQDARTLELARCAPEPRFILLGGWALDEVLALQDQRDIYFINLGMGPEDGAGARHLVDEALRPDRPAYLMNDNATGPWHFNWPGFQFRPVPNCPRVLQIVRFPPAS